LIAIITGLVCGGRPQRRYETQVAKSDTIKLRHTRPFVAKEQGYLVPKKSVFNRIIGDSRLELRFAAFLENCGEDEVLSYAKNYLAVNFKLDYVNSYGDISNYYPDFLVKLSSRRVVIVETKGQEELDVPLKIARLRQWCEDINRVQSALQYDFIFVDEAIRQIRADFVPAITGVL
jgi:type III restriction enzyme